MAQLIRRRLMRDTVQAHGFAPCAIPPRILLLGSWPLAAHDTYMQRALELAELASGCTSPNPLVGAVVVRDGVVVGEGFHQSAGTPHAEIHALSAAGKLASGSTLYITLEPCAHHGRTPPCVEAILDAEVSTVVFAVHDPNPLATGGGDYLESRGIKIINGIMRDQAKSLNRFFFHQVATGKPYVVAKFAASLDGRTATSSGHSKWITGPEARLRGHQLRQAVDAIIIGANTAINDNPSLTVRLPEESLKSALVRHPQRVLLDSHGRVPLSCSLFDESLPGHTWVATTSAMSQSHELELRARDVDVLRIEPEGAVNAETCSRVCLSALLSELNRRNMQSLMVEGGHELLGAFRDAGLINEVWAFLAPLLIGGSNALGSLGGIGADQLDQALRLKSMYTETLGNDLLVRGEITEQRGRV